MKQKLKILFLTTVLPSGKLHGSEIASQSIIDALRTVGCDVEVLGYGRQEDGGKSLGIGEVLIKEWPIETKEAKTRPLVWFISSLLKQRAYSSEKYFSHYYKNAIISALNQKTFDLIFIDHPQIGWVKKYIAHEKIFLVAHNIEHEIYLQHSQSETSKLWKWVYLREARLIKKLEDELAKSSMEVLTLTKHDADYFSKLDKSVNARVVDLPSGFSKARSKSIQKKFDVGIIGSWPWKANEEGLLWFLDYVYPLLPNNLSIKVAGRGADWLAHKYKGIDYLGFVPSAQDFMAESRVVVIPILSGGGIQIKTLDAISSGSMIVTTPTALRGIHEPPSYIKAADKPEVFAKHIVDSISQSFESDVFDEAAAWLAAREAKFIAEIKDAMNNVLPV